MQRLRNFRDSLIGIDRVAINIFTKIMTFLQNHANIIVPLILVVLAGAVIYAGYIILPKKAAEKTGVKSFQSITLVLFTLFLCLVFYIMSCG